MSNQIPEHILSAFQCAETHPMRLAIFEVLDNAIQAELVGATHPDLPDGKSHFARGRLAMIKDLHSDLVALFKEANRPKEAEDPEV